MAIWWLAELTFVAICFGIVLLLSVVASATARMAIDSSVRFYWQCTLIFAGLAAVIAVATPILVRLKQ